MLGKHFGATKFIYNYFLNQRKEFYLANKDKEKKGLNYYDNSAELTNLKKELAWLNEINSQSLQATLKNLDTAYSNFFHKRAKFPKFKSKNNKQSFRIPQNVVIDNCLVKFPKFKEGIKFTKHRKIDGKIRFATISKTPSNQYYVSITVEREIDELPINNNVVGIDLGIKTLVTCSNGKEYKAMKYYKKYQNRLKLYQKSLSRKKKGSSNKDKARLKVSKVYNKIANKRKDTLHKVTTDIIRNNQIIVMEDLNNKGMMKNHCLAKSLNDSSFGMFLQFIKYKCEWYSRQLILIDRFFPSTKTCSNCGYINHSLTLNDREWICPSCNTKHKRDFNASVMILREGMKSLGDGTALRAFGDDVRPTLVGNCQ